MPTSGLLRARLQNRLDVAALMPTVRVPDEQRFKKLGTWPNYIAALYADAEQVREHWLHYPCVPLNRLKLPVPAYLMAYIPLSKRAAETTWHSPVSSGCIVTAITASGALKGTRHTLISHPWQQSQWLLRRRGISSLGDTPVRTLRGDDEAEFSAVPRG